MGKLYRENFGHKEDFCENEERRRL